MARWIAVVTFLLGLGSTAYWSGREQLVERPGQRAEGGVSAQDGTGWPTPTP